MQTIESEQRTRYYVAVQAVAEWVVTRLGARDLTVEDYMEAALEALRRLEVDGTSEHLWIFRDPIVLTASEEAFRALEEREDGSRDWFHADLASAVAAVARFDVMVAISEMACDLVGEDAEPEEGMPRMPEGKA